MIMLYDMGHQCRHLLIPFHYHSRVCVMRVPLDSSKVLFFPKLLVEVRGKVLKIEA